MLDFIWHLRGSVALEGIGSNEIVLDRVERWLEKQRKPVSRRGEDYLGYNEPLWSDPAGPNWLALVIYDRGRFWIEQGLGGRRLRYELRSLHALVFCLFAAFTAFLFGFADDRLSGGLKLAALAFAWLYGMNILLALGRVPRAIRQAVRAG